MEFPIEDRRRIWACLLIILLSAIALSARAAGRIDTLHFHAADTTPLYLTVYTPPAYTSDSVYPVLYLLHGIHGNQYSWEEKGQVSALADSLIGAGLIRPVVIVMPLCMVHDSLYSAHIPSYCRCMGDYLKHIKKGEFERYFPELEAYVSSRYSIAAPANDSLMSLSASCSHHPMRAIAGLSAGGRQAAMISKDGHFEVVGLFSPVLTNDQLPEENIGCVYWIRGGGGDVFYPRARKANRALNHRQVPHNFKKTKGRHNWNTWQRYIEEFLLFTFS